MRDTQDHVLLVEALEKVNGGTLFYPYSMHHHLRVLLLFREQITDFWFVDPQYDFSTPSSWDARPVFEPRGPYRLQETTFFGTEANGNRWVHGHDYPGQRYRAVRPYGKTEVYLHEETGKTMTIHRVRGHPREIMEPLNQISVFCYTYNGGRNNRYISLGGDWLMSEDEVPTGRTGYLDVVLNRMPNGGLIMTDGMHRSFGESPYAEMRKTYGAHTGVSRQRAMSEARSFADSEGRTFRCVGYASWVDMGPTLFWQVTLPT